MDEIVRFFSGSIPLSSANGGGFAPQPQLVILSHKTHSEEIISKNGIQRTVQIVVKNSPFHFQIGVANQNNNNNNNLPKVDFNQIAFDAFLLYDCEGNKEVDYVKVKPIEFKPTPSENGQQLEVELRIKVLTSQHEDMLFKVRIQGYHPITHEEIPGLALLTCPIKVISKPEQLKKRQPSKKRTLTDMLVDTVTRIEKKQEDQQKLIERLIVQQTTAIMAPTQPASPPKQARLEDISLPLFEEFNASTKSQDGKKEEDLPEFEEAFVNLIKAYNNIKPEEKPETVRKLIRSSSTRETERLSELLDLLWTEGLQKEPSFGKSNINRLASNSSNLMSNNNSDGCSCNECPHKLELERIDEFYKEFLSTGVQVPGYTL